MLLISACLKERWISEFEGSLAARATQRNSVSKNKIVGAGGMA